MRLDKYFKSDQFRKFSKEAERLLEDPGKLEALLGRVKAKWSGIKANEEMDQLFSHLSLFTRMCRNIFSGRYKHFPTRSLILVIAGLIYFVTPLDFIPDFIPVTGFVDDLTLLVWIYNSVRHDLDAYRAWENTNIPVQHDPPPEDESR